MRARIGTAKVAAIGERTAERLRGYGIRADLVAGELVAEEVARRGDRAQSHAGDRVLVYRAQEARDVLPRMLEDAGLLASPSCLPIKPSCASDPEFREKVATRRRADVYQREHGSGLCGTCSAAMQPPRRRRAGKVRGLHRSDHRHAPRPRPALHVDVVASRYTTAGLLDALDALPSRET